MMIDKETLASLYREGNNLTWRVPDGFSGELCTDAEDNRSIPLFWLATFKPSSHAPGWFKEHKIDTIEQLMSVTETGLTPSVWYEVKRLQDLYVLGRMWNVCASAASVCSLLEYVIGVWRAFNDGNPDKLYIIATCMGLGNEKDVITQESVADDLGMGGDKRRAAVWDLQNKVEKKLFSPEYRRDLFSDVYSLVDEIVSDDGVVESKKLIAIVENRFGWQGTSIWSMCCFLQKLGYEVAKTENPSDNTVIFRFKKNMNPRREDAFLDLICSAKDAESVSYESLRSQFFTRGLGELSIDEYKSYSDSLLASGKLPTITRGYLKRARDGRSSVVADKRVTFRKVFDDAIRAGKRFLSKEEIVSRGLEYEPKVDWVKAFESFMESDGRLDDNESFVFPYCYIENGKKGRSPTGYALSDCVLGEDIRSGLREMVDELRNSLESSGYRVMGIHKTLNKVPTLQGLDPLGAFFLARGMREFKDKLYFHSSKDMRFCVSLPKEGSKKGTENLLAYEVRKYFSAQGKEYVDTREIKEFLLAELQLELRSATIPWLVFDKVQKKYNMG